MLKNEGEKKETKEIDCGLCDVPLSFDLTYTHDEKG
jgi:hypothetical protein